MTPDAILERTQWDFFWLPPESRVIERPELLYSSTPSDVLALNFVSRTRAPRAQLPPLIDEVLGAHAGRGSRWMVPPTIDRSEVEAALLAGGFAPAHEHYGYVSAADGVATRASSRFVVRMVDSYRTLAHAVAVAEQAFGAPTWLKPQALERELARCVGARARVRRFVAYNRDVPVSCGSMTIFPVLDFAYLWGGGTVPGSRGQGAYAAVVAARIAEARRQGVALVGLYARVDSSAPVVERVGFARQGPMTYWDRPRPAFDPA